MFHCTFGVQRTLVRLQIGGRHVRASHTSLGAADAYSDVSY